PPAYAPGLLQGRAAGRPPGAGVTPVPCYQACGVPQCGQDTDAETSVCHT
ncbi:MAG: hypothetical protein QOH46_13, partial [Solirubrobacteraceae bacterium]|nr:hypothetical protein [Solirubrobacteraceae bacterium]